MKTLVLIMHKMNQYKKSSLKNETEFNFLLKRLYIL